MLAPRVIVTSAAFLAAGALAVPSGGQAAGGAPCLGQPPGANVPQLPGAPLRFGITPGAVAGQVGAPASARPENAPATLAALHQLRPSGGPFVLRLHRFFWSDGEAGIERFLALAHLYTQAGYPVELQLRYHPPAGHDGDVAGWTQWVREVVRRFGPDPGVVGVQVTNEVNFNASADSSDGAYQGARDALIQGVIAARQEAIRLRFDQLKVGFNWFYRTDPSSEQSFWTYLGQRGGPAFAAAVDWVGLDAYPGTFFPPADTPGGERDAVVNALSSLRCYMGVAGLGSGIPIYVEENGYPTGPGRSEQMQASALGTMVNAFNDFRGTYNVTDYRWFDLRDADSSSPNFQQQFGLLHDDYSPKPAFGAYRALVARLSIWTRRAAAPPSPAPGSIAPRAHPRPRCGSRRASRRRRHRSRARRRHTRARRRVCRTHG
ncbi:MAG TPA: hypothetical protein VGY97_05895 [Solirubrobacteraceae bacterium]|nr:hypothetical protein [Solirubrobacteraceae bacterium]